jgi:hypothetical protein
VASAKTASTSSTAVTARTARTTGRVLGAGAGRSRSALTQTESRSGGRSPARPGPRSETSSRSCTPSWTRRADRCGPHGRDGRHGWLAEGLPGRAAKTGEVYRDALGPVLTVTGPTLPRDLTVHDVGTALAKRTVSHSTPILQKSHNCLTRALRHAEGQDLVRRNVSALVDTPRGQEGRPSQALTVEQVAALLAAAGLGAVHRRRAVAGTQAGVHHDGGHRV